MPLDLISISLTPCHSLSYARTMTPPPPPYFGSLTHTTPCSIFISPCEELFHTLSPSHFFYRVMLYLLPHSRRAALSLSLSLSHTHTHSVMLFFFSLSACYALSQDFSVTVLYFFSHRALPPPPSRDTRSRTQLHVTPCLSPATWNSHGDRLSRIAQESQLP
jgi:hypothetical protein